MDAKEAREYASSVNYNQVLDEINHKIESAVSHAKYNCDVRIYVEHSPLPIMRNLQERGFKAHVEECVDQKEGRYYNYKIKW